MALGDSRTASRGVDDFIGSPLEIWILREWSVRSATMPGVIALAAEAEGQARASDQPAQYTKKRRIYVQSLFHITNIIRDDDVETWRCEDKSWIADESDH